MQGMDSNIKKAFDVLTTSRLVEALDLEKEDSALRDRYGRGASTPAFGEDAGPHEPEAVAAQLVPVLQRVAGRAVTADAIRATDGSSFATLSKQFGRVAEK